MLNINELPDYYILDRWKKGSRRGIVLDAYDIEICEDHRKALVGRNGKALDAFLSGFYELSSESIEDQEVGLHLLEEWRLKFKDHLSKNTSNQSAKKHHHDPPESLEFVEPDHARHKGCGKRLKSSIEKATSLNRICSVCKGNGHDKRNCPKFASGKCKEAQVLNKAQNS
ncbi:unnamed protein product [Cuscuta epithymum]|uniref:CCHC-type domain-containing protein n=1 Tax=Cuscuta epithymum TaxID=186058 RepID=A0AAV0DA60_9ASTE|nr:unnamed protein product [Cuscuta epithymum]